MKKLKLPVNPYNGMKIYCNKCKSDNPKCNHLAEHKYRLRIHVAGTKNGVKSKVLLARNYEEALIEAINFKNQTITNNYQNNVQEVSSNDYSLTGAILKYYQYLDGRHEYTHMKKNVSSGHRDESIRFCTFFSDSIKTVKHPSRMKVVETNQKDVARFYTWADSHYGEKTFNKCMISLKAFYKFLIDVEGIQMKNPFETYISKSVPKSDNQTLTKSEFESILAEVNIDNSIQQLGGKGERKNMYRPYLVDGFKLFLLTGGRREEIVTLKWKDIQITVQGAKFFKIHNIKVMRATSKEVFKYIPICEDLYNLLVEMGYHEKKHSDDYILFPEREITNRSMMDILSKSFSHFKKKAKIEKDVSLKNLRKTYLTWVNAVMHKETRILSNHSSDEVLADYYIDPTILSNIEKGALEIKIFG